MSEVEGQAKVSTLGLRVSVPHSIHQPADLHRESYISDLRHGCWPVPSQRTACCTFPTGLGGRGICNKTVLWATFGGGLDEVGNTPKRVSTSGSLKRSVGNMSHRVAKTTSFNLKRGCPSEDKFPECITTKQTFPLNTGLERQPGAMFRCTRVQVYGTGDRQAFGHFFGRWSRRGTAIPSGYTTVSSLIPRSTILTKCERIVYQNANDDDQARTSSGKPFPASSDVRPGSRNHSRLIETKLSPLAYF